jgi:FMN reductase [NAD(P)H]
MNVQDAILKRRSIRSYLDKPVPEADVEAIVGSARWASNAGPYHISVIRNKDLMARINASVLDAMLNSGDDFTIGRAKLPGYQPLHGAPVACLYSAPIENPLGPLNCGLSAGYLILQATELGYGSCFIKSLAHYLTKPAGAEMAREAGIPEGCAFLCGVVFGYTDDEMKFRRMDIVQRGDVTDIS